MIVLIRQTCQFLARAYSLSVYPRTLVGTKKHPSRVPTVPALSLSKIYNFQPPTKGSLANQSCRSELEIEKILENKKYNVVKNNAL